MDDINKDNENDSSQDAAKKSAPAGGTSPVDEKAKIKELEQENKDLKNQVMELQKQVDELEAQSKAAANKSRAAKLVVKLEKSGMTFASDEEREKELGRLAGLSDDAFAATEAAFERAIQAKSECSKESKETDNADEKNKAKPNSAEADKQMRTDAGVRPFDVDDTKASLEDKLKAGFMAAYQERVGSK